MCGDTWSDKELLPRGQGPGWRKARIDEAVKLAREVGLEVYSYEA